MVECFAVLNTLAGFVFYLRWNVNNNDFHKINHFFQLIGISYNCALAINFI